MMKEEFEALAGYKVSSEDYTKIIEPMYMATDLSKEDFVKVINKKRFAQKTKKQIVNALKKEARHLAETCEYFCDWESEKRFEALLQEMNEVTGVYWYKVTAHTMPNYRGCTLPKAIEAEISEDNWKTITLHTPWYEE